MAFNPNILTEKAAKIFQATIELAVENGHTQILPAHLATALIQDEDNFTKNVLEKAGANSTAVK